VLAWYQFLDDFVIDVVHGGRSPWYDLAEPPYFLVEVRSVSEQACFAEPFQIALQFAQLDKSNTIFFGLPSAALSVQSLMQQVGAPWHWHDDMMD
jgi:hypothetical protein